MRQTVNIQVGQCGNYVGTKFWEVISEEHGIKSDGTHDESSAKQIEKVGAYYRLSEDGKYVPRAVMVDSDPQLLDKIRAGTMGNLFDPHNYIAGKFGAGNNWAKGHYTEGAEMVDMVLTVVRKEVEACDSLDGFQMTHSLGGGTGSGLGTLLFSKLREEFPGKDLSSFSVFPSAKVSDTVVEPYNAILSLNQMIGNIDETVCVDNEALMNICQKTLNLKNPTYGDFNHLVSSVLSGVTACQRFGGTDNIDVRGLARNDDSVPKRQRFFIPGIAPITAKGTTITNELTVAELAQQMFDAKNLLAACDPRNGRYLTAGAIFRGSMSEGEVNDSMSALRKESTEHSLALPSNAKTSLCETCPPGIKSSAISIVNSTSINEVFKRLSLSFGALYRRKAFLHWYTAEGMDEAEFTNAHFNVENLIAEYQ